MTLQTIPTIGARAKGTFGPAVGEGVDAAIWRQLESSTFIREVEQRIIGGCGDERVDEDGNRLLLPAAFGGFFTPVLADALTVRLWYRPGMTAEEHALLMAREVRRMFPKATLCVHTDTNAGVECGCAAIAKAPAVLALLIEYADLVGADEEQREIIVRNARELLDGPYFQPGTTKLVDKLAKHGVHKETLAGSHEGRLFIDNDRDGTVVDRPAFYASQRDQGLPVAWAFEYDRWAMASTAQLLTPNTTAKELFFAGGHAFNTIVPYAIFNPTMPVLALS